MKIKKIFIFNLWCLLIVFALFVPILRAQENTNQTSAKTPEPVKTDGVVGTTGSEVMQVTKPVKTDGVVGTTGSEVMQVTKPVKTDGVVGITGFEVMQVTKPVKTDGVVGTTGSEVMQVTKPVKTDGVVGTTGSEAMQVTKPVKTNGVVGTTGSEAMQVSKPVKTNAIVDTSEFQVVHTPKSVVAGDYVGAYKCSNCHLLEFQDFEKQKFNKTWKVLKMRGEEKNGQCLKCHVTGYGKGGFVSEAKTPHLIGKQCEACHGPGGNHASNPNDERYKKLMNIGEKKNICIECHACMTTHKTVNFSYTETKRY